MPSKKFLLSNTIIFSLILEIISVIIVLIFPANIITRTLPYLVVFFLSVSLLSNLWLISVPADNPNKFVRTFMGSTFLKFMLYIIVLVAYSFWQRADAVSFIFCFLTLFVLYLVFDVIMLLKFLPKKR